MQLTTSQYDRQELGKAQSVFGAIHSRKLGIDANQDIDNLVDSIPRIISTVSWLLDGSYGYEYKLLLDQWLSDMPETEKRKAQRMRSIAISTFLLIACLDYPDLNTGKITREFKKRGIDFDSTNNQVVSEIEAWLENQE